MAGTLQPSLADQILDLICRNTGGPTTDTTFTVALYNTDPSGGAGTEITGTVNLTRQAIDFGASSGGVVTGASGTLSFGTANGAATANYWAIHGGTQTSQIYAWGDMSNAPVPIVADNTPSMDSTAITVTLNDGDATSGLTTAFCDDILDWLFNGGNGPRGASGTDTIEAQLSTTTLDAADVSAASYTEATGTGYAGVVVSDTNFSPASAGAITNDVALAFGTATGDWSGGSNMVGIMVINITSNIAMFYDNTMTDQAVGDGDSMTIPIGSFDLALDA